MLYKKLLSVSLIALLIIFMGVVAVNACTSIMVGKDVSVDGSVMTSQTVDSRYDSRIRIIPAKDYENGEMAPIYKNIINADEKPLIKLGEIPQVSHTYKYFHGGYPYANEHQLIIGESSLGGAKETVASDEAIMSIEQLEKFALQRCKTAREAIKLMGKLAEKHGYFGSSWRGESLTLIDKNEAWVFEIYGVGPFWTPESGKSGAVWVAQRVPDNHVTVYPNFSRIREVKPSNDDMMVSDNYKDVAIELGIYDPEKDGTFYWNEVYGDCKGRLTTRLWRGYSKLKPSVDWDFNKPWEYPFSIKPDKKVSYKDIISLFRDTTQGTKYDLADDEAWYYKNNNGKKIKSPLATAQINGQHRDLLDIKVEGKPVVNYYRPIARFYCSYYWVGKARDWLPDNIGGLLWFGLDNPENSPFIPMNLGVNDVPKSWKTLDREKFDRNSAWWAFAMVDDYVNLRYGEMKPIVDKVLTPMQEYMYETQDEIEEKAILIRKEKGDKAANEFLTEHTSSLMNWTEQSYWNLTKDLIFEMNNNRLH